MPIEPLGEGRISFVNKSTLSRFYIKKNIWTRKIQKHLNRACCFMMNFGRIGFSCKKIIKFFVWCEKKFQFGEKSIVLFT